MCILIFAAIVFLVIFFVVKSNKEREKRTEQHHREQQLMKHAAENQQREYAQKKANERTATLERARENEKRHQQLIEELENTLKQEYSTFSRQRLNFERRILKEKLNEAKARYDKERADSQTFLSQNGFTTQYCENCDRTELPYKRAVEAAERALELCESFLKPRL